MFTDNPSELLHPLEAAWDRYVQGFDPILRDCAARVATWLYARDAEYIPNSPFWKFLDVILPGDEWELRKLKWLAESDGSPSICEHGFDRDGRLVLIRSIRAGWRKATCVVYGDGFYDIFAARLNPDSDTFMHWWGLSSPYPNDGRGMMTRIYCDQEGRIVGRLDLSDGGPTSNNHFRNYASYQWKDGIVANSYYQGFQYGIPQWAETKSEAEKAAMFREVDGSLREFMLSRKHISCQYSPEGFLTSAQSFDQHGKYYDTLVEYVPGENMDEVAGALVAALSKAVIQAINNCKSAHPVAFAALIFSSCSAPWAQPGRILLASTSDGQVDPLNWEDLRHEAVWPPDAKASKRKIDSLEIRFMNLVNSIASNADFQHPLECRRVLWRVCQEVQSEFKRRPSKSVAPMFCIYPLDDHNDVDPLEDVRNNLPSESVDIVLKFNARNAR